MLVSRPDFGSGGRGFEPHPPSLITVRRDGVTRLVVLVGRWAIKIVRLDSTMGFVRSWLANESEWRRRRAQGVNAPIWTVVHLVAVYPRADEIGCWDPEDCPFPADGNEERKGSSWGRFGDRWLLVDFDRAWQQPRSLIGWLYYWNQDRLGRKWSKLPAG
jgi:hypothetical protein